MATFRTSTGWKTDESALQALIPGISVSAEMLKNDLEDMDWQTAWHVAGGRRHSSSWRCGLLGTIKDMAAWGSSKSEGELVEASQGEDYRKVEANEEVKKRMHAGEELKKERHCSSIARRWWSKAKIAETKLIIDDDFHRKAEAKIGNAKNSGQTESEWQIVRRRRRTKAEGRHATDEDSLKDSDSSVSLISEDSMCQFVGRRKRQRTDGMKIDGRGRQEHQKEDKIIPDKTDEDTKERQKDLEQETCVITWNVNKSSAQYDFLRDMAQCQANVVMFQETQNWREDGTAEELGWMDPAERRKDCNCSQKEEFEPSEILLQKHKMGTHCSWEYLLSLDVLAAHLVW